MSSFNSGGELALADVLDSLWNYLAGRIMPIAAALAIIGAILNFAAARPWLRLVLDGVFDSIRAMAVGGGNDVGKQ